MEASIRQIDFLRPLMPNCSRARLHCRDSKDQKKQSTKVTIGNQSSSPLFGVVLYCYPLMHLSLSRFEPAVSADVRDPVDERYSKRIPGRQTVVFPNVYHKVAKTITAIFRAFGQNFSRLS